MVARYCRYYTYGRGEVIFNDNSRGDELFIIKRGEVLITKHQDEGDRDIARFIAGESFGDLELFDEAARSTVAVSRSVSVDISIFDRRENSFTTPFPVEAQWSLNHQ